MVSHSIFNEAEQMNILVILVLLSNEHIHLHFQQ